MLYHRSATIFSAISIIILSVLSFFFPNGWYSSIVTGLFTGFIVIFATSIIGYFNTRKIVLKQLYVLVQYWFSRIIDYPLTNVLNYNLEDKIKFVNGFSESDILGIRLIQEEVHFFSEYYQSEFIKMLSEVNKILNLFREVKNSYSRSYDDYLNDKTIINCILEIDKMLIYTTPKKYEEDVKIDEKEIPSVDFNKMPNNTIVDSNENARSVKVFINQKAITNSRGIAVYPKFKSEFEKNFIKHFGKIVGIKQQD